MSSSRRSPSVQSRRRRLWLTAALVLAAFGAYSLRSSRGVAAPAASAPSATPVTVAPVTETMLTEYQEITGRIDAVETVELRARVSGHLQSVHFQAGQLVKQGDILFTIDPRWYRAQFDLMNARAQDADREAKRAEDLLASAAISNEEAENRRAQAAEAKAELAIARLDLEHTEVRAPISGRIDRALLTPGNLISGTPGGGTLLTTIVTVGEVYVYADVDESTLLRFNQLQRSGRLVTEGGRIPVDLQLSDEEGYPRHGYVESAENRLNPETGSLVLRFVFANPDNALIPGLFARVRLPISRPAPTLLISERAIGTDQSQKFVLAVDAANTVVYRPVTLGGQVNNMRIVRAGLKAGERVIVEGLQRVRPGATVAPATETAAVSTLSGLTVAAVR